MGNLLHLFFDVAVVLNINTALGDHGRHRFGLLGVLLRHRQADALSQSPVCLL